MKDSRMLHDTPQEIMIKAGPGVAVGTMQTITNNLPSLILWATAIYSVAQVYLVIKRIWNEHRQKKNSRSRRSTDE
jgi:hypothetical protein